MKKSANKHGPALLAKAITQSKVDAVRLDREEWDFSNCPDEQLEACFFYEIGRECPHLRTTGAFEQAKAATDNERDRRCAICIVDLYKDCPEFPAAAFLTIPKSQRTQRIANLHHAIPPVQADLSALIRQNADNPPKTKTIDYSMGVIAAFYIDLRISDIKLAQGFWQWLRQNRPIRAVPMIRKGKGSSRRQLRKDLKALGALRLLRQMKWEDAYIYTREILKDKHGKPRGLFSDHALPWRRARKQAEKMIAEHHRLMERLI